MKFSLLSRLRDISGSFLYPATCLICRKPTCFGKPLCTDCLEKKLIPAARLAGSGLATGRDLTTGSDRCCRCGRPLISAQGSCISCRSVNALSVIDRIIPLYSYHGAGSVLLTSWKIGGIRLLSEPFAALLKVALSAPPLAGLPVIPVPPRPGKIRKKGWDQIEELCSFLEKMPGITICRLLSRTGGLQQKTLNRMNRENNLKGYIWVNPGVAVPEQAVVLDDLFTTGATLETCASVLKTAGCRIVYGLTLFYD